ncbi:MAG: hypothetical protein A07HB70_00765 [uncultured archaeon A07HB70]|nr:MAG: hypothetical protein A07HB70_00765 [uncultured archaeon A07HB70]
MPIDSETFGSTAEEPVAEPTDAERVLAFLVANADRAFTLQEVTAGVDGDHDAVEAALGRLTERGLARRRTKYWAVGDVEAIRAASDLHRELAALSDQLEA